MDWRLTLGTAPLSCSISHSAARGAVTLWYDVAVVSRINRTQVRCFGMVKELLLDTQDQEEPLGSDRNTESRYVDDFRRLADQTALG